MSSRPADTPPLFVPPLFPSLDDALSLRAIRWQPARYADVRPPPPSKMKAEIRNASLRQRDEIGAETRADLALRLATIGLRLVLQFSTGVHRPVVALFSPIGSEPDTLRLARTLQAAGVDLVLPVDWSHGSPLVYRHWTPGDRMGVGPLGISEPLPDAPVRDPDVLFVPVAAFDRRGHRIGYGAGNVDRTIRGLRRCKTVRTVGVAFAAQEVVRVPNEAHDEAVDFVLTDRDLLACAGSDA